MFVNIDPAILLLFATLCFITCTAYPYKKERGCSNVIECPVPECVDAIIPEGSCCPYCPTGMFVF